MRASITCMENTDAIPMPRMRARRSASMAASTPPGRYGVARYPARPRAPSRVESPTVSVSKLTSARRVAKSTSVRRTPGVDASGLSTSQAQPAQRIPSTLKVTALAPSPSQRSASASSSGTLHASTAARKPGSSAAPLASTWSRIRYQSSSPAPAMVLSAMRQASPQANRPPPDGHGNATAGTGNTRTPVLHVSTRPPTGMKPRRVAERRPMMQIRQG